MLHVWQFSNPFRMVLVSEKKRSKQITQCFLLKTQDTLRNGVVFTSLQIGHEEDSLNFLNGFSVTFAEEYQDASW